MENKTEYRKDMRCSYLDILTDADHPGEAYEQNLLRRVKVPGLAEFYTTETDTEIKYVYKLNTYVSLENWLRENPLGQELIRRILKSVIRVMGAVDEYLLDPDDLVMETAYIFLNETEYYASFIYLPGYKKDFWEQMRSFSEEWLNMVAYEEKEAVFLAYQFYKKVHEPQCVLGAVQEILDEYGQEEAEADLLPDETEDDGPVLRESGRKTAAYVPKAVLGLCLPAIVGLLCLVLDLRIRPWAALLVTAALEIFGSAAVYAATKWKRKKDREPKGDNGKDFYRTDIEDTDVPPDGVPWELIPAREKDGQGIYIAYWPFVIGKVPSEVDYVLDKPRVSHIHARFDRLGWGMTVADMDSSNGTYLNGEKLVPGREYAVNPGDKIRFADVDFICRSLAEPERPGRRKLPEPEGSG